MKKPLCLLACLAVLFAPCTSWSIEVVPGIQVTPLLKASQSWVGDRIEYPSGKPEVTGQLVELAPGAETGWHHHPVASVGYLLEGELTVQFEDGQTRVIKAGEAALESMHMRHNGQNTGNVSTKLVVFYLGVAGGKTTIKSTGAP